MIRPSAVLTNGLISTRVASSLVNTPQINSITRATSDAISVGKLACFTISRAFALSIPDTAEIGILTNFSGVFLATSSISIPPATDAMQRN